MRKHPFAHRQVRELASWFTQGTRYLVLFAIIWTIVLLILFTFVDLITLTGDLAQGVNRNFLRNIAFVIVLVKAYRVLVFYFETMHISIRYLVEISIVAPAVEVIFLSTERSPVILSLLIIFSFANLVLYVFFHDRIMEIDRKTLGDRVDKNYERMSIGDSTRAADNR